MLVDNWFDITGECRSAYIEACKKPVYNERKLARYCVAQYCISQNKDEKSFKFLRYSWSHDWAYSGFARDWYEHKSLLKNEAKNKIESLLFATGRFMNIEEISELTHLPKDQVELSLRELQDDYGKRESSLFLFHENGNWKLAVKDKYIEVLQKIVSDTELDKSVTETLAVIAWKYPILQADVIKLRNNKAYDHLRQLEGLEGQLEQHCCQVVVLSMCILQSECEIAFYKRYHSLL